MHKKKTQRSPGGEADYLHVMCDIWPIVESAYLGTLVWELYTRPPYDPQTLNPLNPKPNPNQEPWTPNHVSSVSWFSPHLGWQFGRLQGLKHLEWGWGGGG